MRLSEMSAADFDRMERDWENQQEKLPGGPAHDEPEPYDTQTMNCVSCRIETLHDQYIAGCDECWICRECGFTFGGDL